MAEDFYADFLALLPPGSSVLDFGCGSGRDLKFFLSRGFDADGVDGSEELCSLAGQYVGKTVFHGDFRTWLPSEPGKKYDGLWACASILHLPEDEIVKCFSHIQSFLADGAVVYAAFKQGIETGCDEKGRYFSNFTDELLDHILNENRSFQLIKKTMTEDSKGRTGFRWINLYLRFNV